MSAKNGYVEDSLESRLLVSKNLGIYLPCFVFHEFINSFSLFFSLSGYIVHVMIDCRILNKLSH